MALKKAKSGTAALVQLTPSSDHRRVPESPPATNRPEPKASDVSFRVVPEDACVQSAPLVEVRMVPSSPTATNLPLPKATRSRFENVGAPPLRGCQDSSGLLARQTAEQSAANART